MPTNYNFIIHYISIYYNYIPTILLYIFYNNSVNFTLNVHFKLDLDLNRIRFKYSGLKLQIFN